MAILAAVICAATSAQAVTIATVPVGSPGNAADTKVMTTDGTSGYGSVGYNYRIGKTEVTNAQYVEFLNGVDLTGTNTLALYNGSMSSNANGGINFNGGAANGSKYEIKPGRDNNPVVLVSWYDSIRFANWLHNGQGAGNTEDGAYTLLGGAPTPSNGNSITRNVCAKWWLPSEDEWYKAAYHKNDGVTGNYWDSPTSTDAVPYSDQPPGSGAPDASNTANFRQDDLVPNGYDDGYAVTGSASFNDSQNYLTDAGAYALSASPYGTFDQGGNVWEWNEALPMGSSRGLRGGYWDNASNILRASGRFAGTPANENTVLGFRVATIPEPSTLLLLCIGSVAVFWWRRLVYASILAAVVCISCADRVRGETIEWTRQLGTSVEDRSNGVSADGLGNVYISGYTSVSGSLDGPSAGGDDAFVSKYDAAGTLQWTRQLGTSFQDESFSVSADGLGNVYISGRTQGSLGGPHDNSGQPDAFMSKYDMAGTLQWTRQLGTIGGFDQSLGVSADGLGNVYIAGATGGSLGGPNAGDDDAFVSKFDAAGTLQWSRQIGTTAGDIGYGVSADRLGNVYLSGWTSGNLGGPFAGGFSDAFVSKYDAAGNLQWSRQLGTSGIDQCRGVSADGLGNVYLSGFTSDSLGGPIAGSRDAFVSKYDAAGTLQWTRQLGSSSQDDGYGISADSLGNVYITGYTTGSLGEPSAGRQDAFVSKYDAAGTLQWSLQLGTSETDWSNGVSADGLGNIYFSGFTTGSLGGPNTGVHDAFVTKIFDQAVPEPTTFVLAAVGLCGCVLFRPGRAARSWIAISRWQPIARGAYLRRLALSRSQRPRGDSRHRVSRFAQRLTIVLALTVCAAASAGPLYNIVPLGFDDLEHTRNDGYKSSRVYTFPNPLNEGGQVIGYSQRYDGGSSDLGQSAWLYNGRTTINIGLTGSEYTSSSGYKLSSVGELNEAGQVTGSSQRYNGGFGTSAWLYNGATTINIGLTGIEHTSNGGRRDSGPRQLNEAGQVSGVSQRYNGGSGITDLGQSVWLYDGATTIHIGLTGAEHTRSDGKKISYSDYSDLMNEAGQVAGHSYRYNGGFPELGLSAWLYNGATTLKLGFTGLEYTRSDGYKFSSASSLNEAGQVIGASNRYNGGTISGQTAWLYDTVTTIPIGLTGSEHTRNDGFIVGVPQQVNEAGKVSGYSYRYNGGSTDLGQSAWRYDGVTTIAIGLTGSEHTRSDGHKYSIANGLNAAGQVSGSSQRYIGGLGSSAWLYDGATTINIGLTGSEHTRNDGYKASGASPPNEAGQVIGYSQRYNGGSTDLGQSAWLYDGATTINIGLTGSEHTRSDGYESSNAQQLNEAGQVSGHSQRYNGGSTDLGQSAWLYDPLLDQTFSLQLSTRSDGFASSTAAYLGEDGLTLGSYTLFDALDTNLGSHAFSFTIADGLHDLGSLVDGGLSANGWDYLASAVRANSLGHILGHGKLIFQSGGQMAYVLTPVPERSTLALAAVAGCGLAMSRRRRAICEAVPHQNCT